MSADSPAPADSTEQVFVGRRARVTGLIGLSIVVAFGALVAVRKPAGGETGVLLGVTALVALISVGMVLQPPQLRVRDGQLFLGASPQAIRSPTDNVRALYYDGGLLRLVFHDLDRVEPPRARKGMAGRLKQQGWHIAVLGYTPEQIDEVRAAIGLTAPGPEEPAGQIETFHRAVLAGPYRVRVTYALVAANVAVYVAMVLSGVEPFRPTLDDLIAWGADYGPRTVGGQWYRLLTAAFVHIGPLHLLFNMIALRDAGRLLERLIGSLGMAALYVVSAVGGSLASLAWHPSLVSAGASGAVFGVFGGLMGFVLAGRRHVPPAALRSVRASGLLFLGYNLLAGWMVPEIDLAAHIGGWAAGFLGGLILSRPVGVSDPRGGLLAVAVVAAGALVVAVSIVPLTGWVRERGRLAATRDEFVAVERRLLDAYNAAIGESRAGRLSDAAFADQIERDILPPWRTIRGQIDALADDPTVRKQPDEFIMMGRYLAARQEAWEALVQALRRQDAAAMATANQKFEEANALVRQLQGSNRK